MMMKQIVLFLAGFLLTGITAAAQMMPDSTVQFVANWKVGDKQAYTLSKKEYKIAEGDTTEVEYSTEIQIFEVLAKTDSTYQLCITYKDVYHSNPEDNELYRLMTETSGEMKALITTNAYGSIRSIDNIDELISYQMKVIDPFIEKMTKDDSEELPAETLENLKATIVDILSDPEVIKSSLYEEAGRMLYFHGSRLSMNKTYTSQTQTESIIPGIKEPITADLSIWINKEYTDEYSAVGQVYASADKESILDYVVDYVKKVMAIAGIAQEEAEKAIEKEKEVFEQMNLSFEELTTCEVHMGTGWPLNVYYVRNNYVTVDGSNTESVKEMDIEIILPGNNEE